MLGVALRLKGICQELSLTILVNFILVFKCIHLCQQ